MDAISCRLDVIRSHLPPQVLLVAVSKNQSVADIMEAYCCGQRHFAESRPQELARKAQFLPKDIKWHFIGHLQTNKIKMTAPFACLIHSADSERLLLEIEGFFRKNNHIADCLLQVHIAKEEQKFGFKPQEALDFFIQNKQHNLPHIRLRGLMGIATNTANMNAVRNEFAELKSLYDQIKMIKPELDFTYLSMGMSADYRAAIEMGSTLVRIGTAVFGKRS